MIKFFAYWRLVMESAWFAFLAGCVIAAVIPPASLVMGWNLEPRFSRTFMTLVVVSVVLVSVTGIVGFTHVIQLTPEQFVAEFNAARNR
jgi:hypothetical protein